MSALSKRRRELRSELSLIEKQIYDLETNYLEETKDFGNIFTGWSTHTLSQETIKQRKNILTEDRLFSLSSVTSPAARREEFKKSGKAAEAAAKSKIRRAQKKKAEEEMKQGLAGSDGDVMIDAAIVDDVSSSSSAIEAGDIENTIADHNDDDGHDHVDEMKHHDDE